jgi:hypothetical protein
LIHHLLKQGLSVQKDHLTVAVVVHRVRHARPSAFDPFVGSSFGSGTLSTRACHLSPQSQPYKNLIQSFFFFFFFDDVYA